MILGFWLSDLCILGFGFFFFLESVGLLYCLPSVGLFFFCLDWVCFTFRIDIGLFCGLALLQYIYIFLNLRVFLIFLRVFLIFFKDKQIKKFNYYI